MTRIENNHLHRWFRRARNWISNEKAEFHDSPGARMDAYRSNDKGLDIFLMVLLSLFIVMAVAWIMTLSKFTPAFEQVRADQQVMQTELDQIKEDLTKVSDEIAAWPGVTELVEMTVVEAEAANASASETKSAETTNKLYVGEFEIFAYDHGPNGLLTASGATCQEGVTVAAVWSVFPKGTRLYIEDIGYRTVQDKCSNPKALDVYMKTASECFAWGKRTREVWIIK